MTLYVYEVDTNKIVAEYEGNSNAECEAACDADGHEGWGEGDWNDSGLATTYTPAFGTSDGLHY
jgi:hypothetical protein